jgi:hypothetical protein
MMRTLLPFLLGAFALTLAGCGNRPASRAADADIIHGSVGVRYESQNTARFAPEHAPF